MRSLNIEDNWLLISLCMKFKYCYVLISYTFNALRFSKRGFEWVSLSSLNMYCMFLFQIKSFKFHCIRTHPCIICIIQIGMNIREPSLRNWLTRYKKSIFFTLYFRQFLLGQSKIYVHPAIFPKILLRFFLNIISNY